MKYTVLLLAAFFAMNSCAQKRPVYGPEHKKKVNEYRKERQKEVSIAGFWQEYSRTVVKKRMAEQALEFTDTLKVVIRDDSITRFYDKYGRMTAGRLSKQNGVFYLGNGQSFTSIEKLGDILKLSKDHKFFYLKKVSGFYTKPIGMQRGDITDEDNKKIELLDAYFLQGKWKVYKKEDPNFSRKKSYLHSIDVGESKADGTYDIVGRFHNAELLVKDTGFLDIEGEKLVLELKKQTQAYQIMKAQDTELILEQGAVVYYLKNLSK